MSADFQLKHCCWAVRTGANPNEGCATVGHLPKPLIPRGASGGYDMLHPPKCHTADAVRTLQKHHF